MLKKIRIESLITSDAAEIENAQKIILPGVGSFDQGMGNLNSLGLVDILNRKVLHERIPVLGICLGMQLMTSGSEEGSIKGLGWIDAKTLRFAFKDTAEFKIPHMGWNFISCHKESRLFRDMYDGARFYFVHSYYVSNNQQSDILTTTTYETEFTSAFEKDNIAGVQFHPEKSHKFGMLLLKNFSEL
jgi:glutamine amidotransferase